MIKCKLMQKIPRGAFVFFAIGGAAAVFSFFGNSTESHIFQERGETHVVELRGEGFSPSELIIAKDDIVIFANSAGRYFWPASNLHPTHGIYPEFDPREPIAPGESWSFRFIKPGRWEYHDHLYPLFRGIIIVEDRNFSTVVSGQEFWNWSDILKSTMRSKGISVAFEVFEELFNTEPAFAENCHSYTHILGEEAYRRFGAEQDIELTSSVAYCSYGFFHGFLETMIQEEGSLKRAREFCVYVDKQLHEEVDTIGACFHGIGHGVADPSNQSFGENFLGLVSEGLKLCEEVGDTEQETKLCGTGVFNALAIMYLSPEQYNLNFDRTDPYKFCREQELPVYFKEACYEDFKILPMNIESNNFAKAAHYVEAIKEDRYAFAAMDTVSSYTAYFLLRDSKLRDDAVRTCYTLQERLWGPCIAGLGAGLLGQSTPDREYRMALDICNSSLVKERERVACYERVGRLIGLRYSREKAQKICGTIENKYQKYCQF